MTTFNIRQATPGDESSIARIHIQSWQETNCGLIPQEYLDNLSAAQNLKEFSYEWQMLSIFGKT